MNKMASTNWKLQIKLLDRPRFSTYSIDLNSNMRLILSPSLQILLEAPLTTLAWYGHQPAMDAYLSCKGGRFTTPQPSKKQLRSLSSGDTEDIMVKVLLQRILFRKFEWFLKSFKFVMFQTFLDYRTLIS